MDMQLIAVAGLVAVTITLWATRGLPEYLTALLFFAFAMILHVAPASLVFSGFTSAAFWLVISGYVIGIAIRKTGLASRCAGGARGLSFQIVCANGLWYCRPHVHACLCYAFQHGAYCTSDADCPGAC